jgi:hypothetical protein
MRACLASRVLRRAKEAQGLVNEEEVIAFIRAHIASVYTLELLLLVRRNRDRSWQANDLVKELRSSGTAVTEALTRLVQAGLISEDADRHFRYAPASPERERIAEAIEKAYASTPLAVVKAIVAAPDQKLQAFSDAFRLKE